MKCEIVFNFSFSATGQFSSNFDFNISAQIRTRSSEERQEVEQQVLAFEAAHQHRIERECDEGCPSNDEGGSQQLPNSDVDPRLVINEQDDEDKDEAEEDG